MRVARSKKWWLVRAAREAGRTIGAGVPGSVDPKQPMSVTATEENRIAFGRFVNLMRRSCKLSVEDLARKAELEPSELLIIEDDVHSMPEPRTVYRLAQFFDVSQGRLMQLAGLAAANDANLRQEAVRFAARSESIEALTPEQSAALQAFFAVLSEDRSKKK
jgi:HTH-type transcriptional regulator, competence development regulator